MHNWHGQFDFHFLILDLKASKQEHSFIIPRTKAQTFGAKKENISVPYFTVVRSRLENSLCVLRLYVNVLLILKTYPMIAGKSPSICLYISIAKVCIFLRSTEKEVSLSKVPEILIYNQNKQFLVLFRVHCWFYCFGVWSETSRIKDNK